MLALVAGWLLAGAPTTAAFTASLLVTNQPSTLFMRWEQGEKIELPNVQKARRGEPIAALLLFSGCGADRSGNCDVKADIVVLDPSGKVYGESKSTEVWVGRPAPSAGATQLGVGYLMIRIEPKDPPGLYTIKAHVKDHISGATVDREHSFEVPTAKTADSPAWPAGRPKSSLERAAAEEGDRLASHQAEGGDLGRERDERVPACGADDDRGFRRLRPWGLLVCMG